MLYLPLDQQRDFYLYVDEFQNFATTTFIKILSEACKYALNLLVTHQYIDQIEPSIQDAILGNVGTLVNYVVGPKDASRLEREYTPHLSSEDLVNQEKFNFVIKETIDGAQSYPFTGELMLMDLHKSNLKEEVKHLSRANYSTKRDIVEEKLHKWATNKYNDKGNLIS
ncbi:MAG: hypothetical protein Q9M91_06465 [Candidatus Dojkabacteria bacterium]|nr:hypothetical protein [Candidatus Dojkabacteria bacterium]MDQ7021439.1 hypothetical protein [Candidatus Dojkabacteria bacterium]